MIIEDAPEAYGYTIFCDDIRVEVGNKLTLVGIYAQGLVIHGSFPFVMPKLAMHIIYMQRHPNVIPISKFLVFLPDATGDDPSFQIEVPAGAVEQAAANAGLGAFLPGEDVYMTMTAQLGILNLVISQPGLIKVRAFRGDRLVRLGSFNVLAAPPADPNS
jgi:hypothetical protein